MKRNIILYHTQRPSISADFTDCIDIRQLDDIVNHSVDTLYCESLEFMTEQDAVTAINKMQHKLRSNGTLIIKILDVKKICLDFIQNQLPSAKYIEFISNKRCLINLDLLASNINHALFITTKIDPSDYYIGTVFTRKQIND